MPYDNRLQKNSLASQAARLPAAWQAALQDPPVARALADVTAYVEQRLAAGAVVYPATPFRALDGLALADVRVVILGQDPYHGPGQAQGLAFSVPDDSKRPPSLRNIFNQIAQDCPGTPLPRGNDLSRWTRQGVLLLNTCLTVEDGQPASHAKRGWEIVTDALIGLVARDPSPKAFLLWGAHAQAKQVLLPRHSGHLVLTANHPSPLSARRPPVPFVGCGHFARVNAWLAEQGKTPIDWTIEDTGYIRQGDFGL